MKNTKLLFFALLAAVALVFAAGCSDSSDDDTITASDLAGTTWEYSTKDGDETHTLTVKFESGGKVTFSSDYYDENGSLIEGEGWGWSYTYTYSVSGSTVTLYDEDGDVAVQFTYSSGNLSYTIEDDGESFTYIYTKVS